MTTAKSVQATRKRMAERGLTRVEVWARPEDCERIKAFASQLRGIPEPTIQRKQAAKKAIPNSVFALGAA